MSFDVGTALDVLGEQLERQLVDAARAGIDSYLKDAGLPLEVDIEVRLNGFLVVRSPRADTHDTHPLIAAAVPSRRRPGRPAGQTKSAVEAAVLAGARNVPEVYEALAPTGVSRQQVRTALSQMAKAGTLVRSGERGSSTYTVPPPADAEAPPAPATNGGSLLGSRLPGS